MTVGYLKILAIYLSAPPVASNQHQDLGIVNLRPNYVIVGACLTFTEKKA